MREIYIHVNNNIIVYSRSSCNKVPLGSEQKKCGLRSSVYLREIKNAVLIFYITAHQVKPQLALFVIRATRKYYTIMYCISFNLDPEYNISYTTSWSRFILENILYTVYPSRIKFIPTSVAPLMKLYFNNGIKWNES